MTECYWLALARDVPYARYGEEPVTAGVHFRRDEIEGIVLGELSAFSVMADVNATYNEGFDGFRLTSFDGTPTTI